MSLVGFEKALAHDGAEADAGFIRLQSPKIEQQVPERMFAALASFKMSQVGRAQTVFWEEESALFRSEYPDASFQRYFDYEDGVYSKIKALIVGDIGLDIMAELKGY